MAATSLCLIPSDDGECGDDADEVDVIVDDDDDDDDADNGGDYGDDADDVDVIFDDDDDADNGGRDCGSGDCGSVIMGNDVDPMSTGPTLREANAARNCRYSHRAFCCQVFMYQVLSGICVSGVGSCSFIRCCQVFMYQVFVVSPGPGTLH